jgi:hypothetical protein
MTKLAVIVLGNENSGKSETWYQLFGKRNLPTRKRLRTLNLSENEAVEVFLANGSMEERNKKIEDVINKEANIVLCSVQYVESGLETLEYFIKNDFEILVQWLNPGYSDGESEYFDSLGMKKYLADNGASITTKSGKIAPKNRVDEMRIFIYGWAKKNKLLFESS